MVEEPKDKRIVAVDPAEGSVKKAIELSNKDKNAQRYLARLKYIKGVVKRFGSGGLSKNQRRMLMADFMTQNNIPLNAINISKMAPEKVQVMRKALDDMLHGRIPLDLEKILEFKPEPEKDKDERPELRMDRRYRCLRCEELSDPKNHEGCWGREKGKDKLLPICPSCEQDL